MVEQNSILDLAVIFNPNQTLESGLPFNTALNKIMSSLSEAGITTLTNHTDYQSGKRFAKSQQTSVYLQNKSHDFWACLTAGEMDNYIIDLELYFKAVDKSRGKMSRFGIRGESFTWRLRREQFNPFFINRIRNSTGDNFTKSTETPYQIFAEATIDEQKAVLDNLLGSSPNKKWNDETYQDCFKYSARFFKMNGQPLRFFSEMFDESSRYENTQPTGISKRLPGALKLLLPSGRR